MAKVQEWDQQAFAAAAAEGVVLVDFYAVWCGPCKMMMSVLEKAVEAFDDAQLKVGKVNIDQCRELAAEHGVRTIPTFKVIKNGKVVATLIGVQSQKRLVEAIESALA
ncbi:MAG: thioredoxin family protein [Lentisphaerae bacterium]|nr:thioredoxin family protein [Lentisphaerota bacterium]